MLQQKKECKGPESKNKNLPYRIKLKSLTYATAFKEPFILELIIMSYLPKCTSLSVHLPVVLSYLA
jgi:hypothetical protein